MTKEIEVMKRRILAIAFVLALTGTLVTRARADADDKAIQLSVNGPVEIPGAVLSPGKYRLELMGDGSDVAEIWSADGSKFYGFFGTEPAVLSHAPTEAKVVLEGSGKTHPKRIEEWFYPGDLEGNAFIYPKAPDLP
jgi:hypothetical protein